MSNIKNPHAAIIVWNYKDRLDANKTVESGSALHATEPKIFNTVSCLKISTSKSKSQPQGSFEIRLAPTKNWVTVLSAGSWLCILMSQQKIQYKDLTGRADPNKVKMLGRIDSVRAHVTVNQQTGARRTEYVVQGIDWGGIFNTMVYIDPLMRDVGEGSFWATWKIMYEKYAANIAKDGLYKPRETMRALLELWGTSKAGGNAAIIEAYGYEKGVNQNYDDESGKCNLPNPGTSLSDTGSLSDGVSANGVTFKATTVLEVPSDVKRYFGFENTALTSIIKSGAGYEGVVSPSSKKYVDIENGSTIYYDRYSGGEDAVGFIQPNSIFGAHTLWQLLMDNCNEVINELIPEMRWDSGGRAQLVLYRRIRPFIFREKFEGKGEVEKLASYMYNLRTVTIPKDEILAVDVGTNWRDKINFVEIMPDQSLAAEGFVIPHESKLAAQSFDTNAFSREGFRPLMKTTKYLAPTQKNRSYDPLGTTKWKYLLREWHFNNHLLLNGNIVFIGQNNYIQVGDNIMFDESIITSSHNTNIDSLKLKDNNPQILAHVEAVSHNFTVDANGARSYVTTISFVRGIVVGKDRKPLNSWAVSDRAEGRIDNNTRSLLPTDDLNKKDVFGTSSENDPDADKLDGS